MSTNSPKITTKNVANLETSVPKALQAVDLAESHADDVRSDAYALFATAVLIETANKVGDRKGTAVRKLIAETATTAGFKFAKGSLSKAETVLAHLVGEFHGGEFDAYSVDQYAYAYEALKAKGGTLWSVYAEITASDDQDDDQDGDQDGAKEYDGLRAFGTVIARLRKDGATELEIKDLFSTALAGGAQ